MWGHVTFKFYSYCFSLCFTCFRQLNLEARIASWIETSYEVLFCLLPQLPVSICFWSDEWWFSQSKHFFNFCAKFSNLCSSLADVIWSSWIFSISINNIFCFSHGGMAPIFAVCSPSSWEKSRAQLQFSCQLLLLSV